MKWMIESESKYRRGVGSTTAPPQPIGDGLTIGGIWVDAANIVGPGQQFRIGEEVDRRDIDEARTALEPSLDFAGHPDPRSDRHLFDPRQGSVVPTVNRIAIEGISDGEGKVVPGA